MIGNKIANIITKLIEKYLDKVYISRRKAENYWWSKINIVV